MEVMYGSPYRYLLKVRGLKKRFGRLLVIIPQNAVQWISFRRGISTQNAKQEEWQIIKPGSRLAGWCQANTGKVNTILSYQFRHQQKPFFSLFFFLFFLLLLFFLSFFFPRELGPICLLYKSVTISRPVFHIFLTIPLHTVFP